MSEWPINTLITVYHRDKRKRSDPWTPDKTEQQSKRGWDGLVRMWRRRLHNWDPPVTSAETIITDENVVDKKEKIETEHSKVLPRHVVEASVPTEGTGKIANSKEGRANLQQSNEQTNMDMGIFDDFEDDDLL